VRSGCTQRNVRKSVPEFQEGILKAFFKGGLVWLQLHGTSASPSMNSKRGPGPNETA
ncbi:hypothetical protein ABEB36_015861, partial [Hypothenemus hampei]